MMNLFVPLSVMVSDGVTQLVVFKLVFCCNANPVEGDGHEIIANPFDCATLNKLIAQSVRTQ